MLYEIFTIGKVLPKYFHVIFTISVPVYCSSNIFMLYLASVWSYVIITFLCMVLLSFIRVTFMGIDKKGLRYVTCTVYWLGRECIAQTYGIVMCESVPFASIPSPGKPQGKPLAFQKSI